MKFWGSKVTIPAGLVLATFLLAENGALHSHEFTLKRSKEAKCLPWELSVTKSSSLVVAPSSFQDVMEYTCVYYGKKYVAVGSNETLFRLALDHLWGLDDVPPGRIYKRSIAQSGLDWEELQKVWPSGRVVIQKSRSEDLNHSDLLAGFPEKCQMFAGRTARGLDANFIPIQDIRNYISEHFGVEKTNEMLLLSDVSSTKVTQNVPVKESDVILKLKGLAEWFCEHFPYYYSSCEHSSCEHSSCEHSSCIENKTEHIYLGKICASDVEDAEGGARRTELYLCNNCNRITRFPRYLGLKKVLEKRRGRCGEYSVLMVRMLQALGYVTRWVVDWGDHCWAETLVNGRWVHVDPCEAIVDEPSFYESNGKNLTFCVAYSLSPTAKAVDVTDAYCTDMKSARLRRGMISSQQLNQLLQKATNILSTSNITGADVTK